MKPIHISRLSIPLCRILSLPLVKLILELDVQLFENTFVKGCCEGNKVLYVSIVDNKRHDA